MLTPKKNPLIDQPLVAASERSFRLARIATWTLSGLIAAFLLGWFLLLRAFGQDIYSEHWWRQMVAQYANRQFQLDMGNGHNSQLSEQVQTLEAERLEMQTKIQGLERLVQNTQIDAWLRTFSARRRGSDDVDYEILISNPKPNNANASGNILITVRGIDRFDPNNPGLALAQSATRFKTMRHKIRTPEVAEAIKGQLNSRISNFLIVTVVPFDDPNQAEIAIIPIAPSARSQ